MPKGLHNNTGGLKPPWLGGIVRCRKVSQRHDGNIPLHSPNRPNSGKRSSLVRDLAYRGVLRRGPQQEKKTRNQAPSFRRNYSDPLARYLELRNLCGTKGNGQKARLSFYTPNPIKANMCTTTWRSRIQGRALLVPVIRENLSKAPGVRKVGP